LTFRYLDAPDANGVTAEDAFQASVPVGNPFGVGPFAGGLAVSTSTRLWGTEANVVVNMSGSGDLRWQVLGGFRYVNLDENLDLLFNRGAVNDAVVFFQGTPFPAPAVVSSIDSFHLRNQFYGGQIGARGEYQFGALSFVATTKVALGATHEVQSVSGSSTLFSGAVPPVTAPGGQFAAASNSGHFSRDVFAVIPEVEVKAGYQVMRSLRLYVGYDFLYWSRVIRPGRQVDLIVDTRADQVDPAFVPGFRATFPQRRFVQSDFWAQVITFGLELGF